MEEVRPAGPVVGVGVAVFRGDRVLLVQRGTEPHRGHWSIPGGRVERGESLAAAAMRELAEECGISVTVGEPALILNRVVRDDRGQVRYHFVIIDFIAEYAEGKPEPVPGSDAQAVRWVAPSELASLPMTPHLEPYLRRIIAARQSGQASCILVEET